MIEIKLKPSWITEKEITQLLHSAYARHLQSNLRFAAATQTEEDTKVAMDGGKTFVALDGDILCGTTTTHLRYDPQTNFPYTYAKMVAVAPEYQGRSIAVQLLKAAETAFPEAKKLIVDTAADAEGLVQFYIRLGFRATKYFCWENTNYISVQLEKILVPEDVSAQKRPVGIFVANSPQIYSVLPIAEELTRRNIDFDFIVPDIESGSGNWELLYLSTYQLLADKGYTPLKQSEIDHMYKILFAPYHVDIIKSAEHTIRYRYSVITKPDFSYRLDNTIPFDYVLCYGHQDAFAFGAYTNTLLVGNPRALNFAKKVHQKKTLLYAPTYSTSLDFNAIAAVLNTLKDTYHIILKLHPGSEFLDGDNISIQNLRNSCSEVIQSNMDIMDLLETTDLLLSDYSGAVFDALSVNIPAVLIRIGDKAPITRDGSVLNQMILDNTLPCCFHPDEVIAAVEYTLAHTTTQDNSRYIETIFSIAPELGLKNLGDTVSALLATPSDFDRQLERNRKIDNLLLTISKADSQGLKMAQLRQMHATEISALNNQLEDCRMQIDFLQRQIAYYENGKLYKLAKKLYNLKGTQ